MLQYVMENDIIYLFVTINNVAIYNGNGIIYLFIAQPNSLRSLEPI